MTTTKTPARNPSAKATPPKRATRTTKQAAPAADPKPTRARFGPTECHAPGCGGERYLKGSLLCREHEAAWRAGTFRLSARGWARLNAQKPADAKPAPRARKAATAPVAQAAFASPELAAKARAKRADQRGPRS